MSTLKSRIPKIVATLDTRIQNGIVKGLEPIAKQAQTNAPEDTFFSVANVTNDDLFLVRAIQLGAAGRGMPPGLPKPPDNRITGGPGFRVNVGIYGSWYYYFREHGTAMGEHARPFLWPAWESGKQQLLQQVKNSLGSL